MGRARTPSTTPDLFSTVSARESSSASDSPPPPTTNIAAAEAKTPSLPYVLPKDLPQALAQLQNQELDRLFSAVLTEAKRRGRKLPEPDENSRKPRVETAAATLPSGKLNAVRAAFKAGVKPSYIARQFGISQADVRKALMTEGLKTWPTESNSYRPWRPTMSEDATLDEAAQLIADARVACLKLAIPPGEIAK
jgi:hypothetical protein